MTVDAFAIKSPSGSLVTWTAFRTPGHPWLQYLNSDRWDDEARRAVERLKAEGYREVCIQIIEVQRPTQSEDADD